MESRIISGSAPMTRISVEDVGAREYSKGKIMVALAQLGLWAQSKALLESTDINGINGWDSWNTFLTFKDGDAFFEAGKELFKQRTGRTDEEINAILDGCVAD